MSAALTVEGIAEMRAALKKLPEHVTRELIGPIVLESAERLAAMVYQRYPPGKTGALRRGVRIEPQANPLRAIVRSGAATAHLYERGTVRRKTGRGANRGTMKGAHVFVNSAINVRAQMVEDVKRALSQMTVPDFEGTLTVTETGAR